MHPDTSERSPSKFTWQLAGQSLYTLPQFEMQANSAMEFAGFACFNTPCIIVSWKPMVKGSLQVKALGRDQNGAGISRQE